MKGSERHRVKRDELVTVFERVWVYIEENLRLVSLATVSVAVLALVGIAARYIIEDRNEKASFLLGQIIQTYRAPVALTPEAEQAPAGVTTYATAGEREGKVVELADDLVARYGWTRAAPKARYYKAIALEASGRHEEAAKAFDGFLRSAPHDFLAPLARFGLGKSQEALGRHAEALTHYLALGEDTTGAFPRQEALLAAARCQEALGKKEDALKTYRRIVSEFPGSEYEAEARTRIDRLS